MKNGSLELKPIYSWFIMVSLAHINIVTHNDDMECNDCARAITLFLGFTQLKSACGEDGLGEVIGQGRISVAATVLSPVDSVHVTAQSTRLH